MLGYGELIDKVVNRAKELVADSVAHNGEVSEPSELLIRTCLHKAIRECIVDPSDKLEVIENSCIDLDELFYSGTYGGLRGTPYETLFGQCLYRLIR